MWPQWCGKASCKWLEVSFGFHSQGGKGGEVTVLAWLKNPTNYIQSC